MCESLQTLCIILTSAPPIRQLVLLTTSGPLDCTSVLVTRLITAVTALAVGRFSLCVTVAYRHPWS